MSDFNVFTAFKGSHFYILFVVTAAGVVPCGSFKKGPVNRPQCSLYFTFGPLRAAEIF